MRVHERALDVKSRGLEGYGIPGELDSDEFSGVKYELVAVEYVASKMESFASLETDGR